jgi:hypothetical protein
MGGRVPFSSLAKKNVAEDVVISTRMVVSEINVHPPRWGGLRRDGEGPLARACQDSPELPAGMHPRLQACKRPFQTWLAVVQPPC